MLMNRFTFIDYSKCFGILLITVGHFLPPGNIIKIVWYNFHVPLFFMISGFLFNVKSGGGAF